MRNGPMDECFYKHRSLQGTAVCARMFCMNNRGVFETLFLRRTATTTQRQGVIYNVALLGTYRTLSLTSDRRPFLAL